MEQSPSWEVIKSSANQEIPCLLGNLKDHYHIHRSLPSVPILRQINPVHAPPPTHFLQMNFNIILPSSSGFSKWCPSLKSPHQKLVCTSSPSQYMLHALPIHLFFYVITGVIFGEEYRPLSSLFCSLLHSPFTSSLLGPNVLLRTLFSYTLSLCTSLNVSDQVLHLYKTIGKIIVLCILIIIYFDSKKMFYTKW